jgi:hypothetical protein
MIFFYDFPGWLYSNKAATSPSESKSYLSVDNFAAIIKALAVPVVCLPSDCPSPITPFEKI